jgi:D-alanyl-lipoteichoic acid acyltransferase DltB (MBOAT superfamily)
MWLLAFALYGGCKWLTFWGALKRGGQLSAARALGYLFLWPGMDAESFLGSKTAVQRPGPAEWAHAAVKVLIGVALIWVVTPLVAVRLDPLLAGWIGMAGLVLLLHFGLFHLLSLAWRSCGVNAERLMRAPFRARSLAEFWGRRWNTAFHQVAEEFLFRPLRPAVGARTALLFVFLVSGWVHELVISLPARGGYSLPTAYFLLQGVGVLAERSRLGRWLRLGAGWRGRLFTLAMTGAPAVALFHPPFVQHVMLPFLKTIGAH